MAIDERLLTGRAIAAPAPVELRAGPVTALLDGADLRHVRLGPVELVQRVYMALRDAPWNTIPGVFANWRIEQGDDRFLVTFDARHAHEAIDFTWCGGIEGRPDGTIRYELDGTCHGAFKYSKIGFNVHHALDRAIGHAYRAATEAGELRGVLPVAIDPQRIVGTTLTGMFEPYRELALEVAPGLEAVIALEGDILEMQDHRNWTDGNFKSYATPLALGFPFDSTNGQRIRQVLTIGFAGPVPLVEPERPPTIAIGGSLGSLPRIGFGQPSHGEPLSANESARLRIADPAHLRVDLVLNDPAALTLFVRAAEDARAVGAALELAIHANESSGEALDRLAAAVGEAAAPVARVLVYYLREGFSALLGFTPPAVVRLVRDRLGPVTGPVPYAGGTNQSFSDINRDRPTDPVVTGVCFSVSPTVHAADDASIVENLVGQSEVVAMARSFAGGRPISVSPVTIATRFGPYPAGPSAPGDLPSVVDVRQASLLGAAWTVGSIKHLAEAGAESVTYYETTGWRGVVERDGGAPDARFPSRPGEVYPMFHVFADVAGWRGATVLAAPSSQPLAAEALAVEDEAGQHLLVASLQPAAGRAVVTGLRGTAARTRTLDAGAAATASADPMGFRERSVIVPLAEGRLELALGPYAVVRVDAVR
ncbi:MAG TPA: hypothetical protein VLS28_11905 [Candidatus Sulfomarinibacteraceae bacterium]|nr:hypothetical protein [Candidatus Sulfomarinibacteraceae bacterium]